VRSALGGAAAGGLLAYLLDPRRGRARLRTASQRSAAAVRRAGRRLARALRVDAALARGQMHSLVHRLRRPQARELDDATLAHKVESVVFRDPRIPKGQISVNAEQGAVFLRGEVESPELIEDLEQAVRAVAGVRSVESLLHLPGTPAPHARGGALLGR
jgi:osmotically-inducible protein OsmY